MRHLNIATVFCSLSAVGLLPTPGIAAQTTPATPAGSAEAAAATPGAPSEIAAATPDASADTTSDNRAPIEEIVVTAQKREAYLSDVPMGASAISGYELTAKQFTRLEDYVSEIPGLNLISGGPTTNQLVLRGISTGSSSINGSVATYIDETPYGFQGPFAGSSSSTPDLDTYDLQRVEVLKGPQGTLYGAMALGGLLKYVTNAPDPSGYAASVQVGGNTVDNGGTGSDLHGMVNVPLSDQAAARVVVYDNYYGGFTSDPSRGASDINGAHVSGGRASLLYKPLPELSIRLNALYQTVTAGDDPAEDVASGTLIPLYGDYKQKRLFDQVTRSQTEVYNATVNYDLGFANLVSATSYTYKKLDSLVDASGFYGPVVAAVFGGNDGVAALVHEPESGIAQEFRLQSEGDGPLEWQVGGYSTREEAREKEALAFVDAGSGTVLYNQPPALGTFYIKPTYTEYAGFADLDYHVFPTVDVEFGGRYSSNNQSYHQLSSGVFTGTTNILTKSAEDVFTYSADARWHWTPTEMAYFRVATGYVPGGPNDVLPNNTLPSSYTSSTTTNYEVGLKSSFDQGHFTVDVDAFHIDWDKVQLETLVGAFAGITNGGAAGSDGLEWNFQYVPLQGLKLSVNGAYTDARLTANAPANVGGLKGDRLPYSALWSGAANADYERPITDSVSAFIGGNYGFTGSRNADFSNPGPRQHLPAYGTLNLRAGINSDNWTLTLFVKNVTNEVGIVAVSAETAAGGAGLQSAAVTPPRTIGLTLSSSF